jgi:CRISPR-associated Cas5-like protein
MKKEFLGQYPIGFEVAGDYGMWAAPPTGSESVSYPMPSASGCIGMIDSICRLAATQIQIVAVATCTVPRWINYTYNSYSLMRHARNLKLGQACQHHELVLQGPRFQILALAKNQPWKHPLHPNTNSAHSFQEQFFRRLRRGQSFFPVSMGRKEFVCTEVCHIKTPIEQKCNLIIPSLLISIFDKDGKVSDKSVVTQQNVMVQDGVMHVIDNVATIMDGLLAFKDSFFQSQIQEFRNDKRVA